jgi:hypothetical protein
LIEAQFLFRRGRYRQPRRDAVSKLTNNRDGLSQTATPLSQIGASSSALYVIEERVLGGPVTPLGSVGFEEEL